ncbi:hypothetical protein JYU34_019308, partial [Plutella xylostella]
RSTRPTRRTIRLNKTIVTCTRLWTTIVLSHTRRKRNYVSTPRRKDHSGPTPPPRVTDAARHQHLPNIMGQSYRLVGS